jgi:hypothetical protein
VSTHCRQGLQVEHFLDQLSSSSKRNRRLDAVDRRAPAIARADHDTHHGEHHAPHLQPRGTARTTAHTMPYYPP